MLQEKKQINSTNTIILNIPYMTMHTHIYMCVYTVHICYHAKDVSVKRCAEHAGMC